MESGTSGVDRVLPTLTREELRALEDEPVVALVEEDRWWSSLPDAERTQIRAAAARGLLARDLVWPSRDAAQQLQAHPDLALLLIARHEPTWVMALGERGLTGDGSTVEEEPNGSLLICGTPDAGTDGAAICAHVDGLYLNRLTTRELAVEAATNWLLRVPSDPEEVVQRSVDVLCPDAPQRTGLVMGAGNTWLFTEPMDEADDQESPGPIDQQLSDWLRSKLEGMNT